MEAVASRKRVTRDMLLDASELAGLLGVSVASLATMRAPSRRHRYRKLDGMPEPIGLIQGNPVWDRAAVEKWMLGMS